MATVLRIRDAGGRNGNTLLEQPVSLCCPAPRMGDGGVTAGGAKSWDGVPQSRPGCSQRTQGSVDISDALHGLARCRCIYGPSPLLEEETQNPHMVAQSSHWIMPGRRNGGTSGEGKLWSAETVPKAMERIWLVVKWWGRHHGRAGGGKHVKAVLWLCIFCTGSAVTLH